MNVSVSEKPPAGWDAFLSQSEFGTFYQTSLYSSYAEREAGFKPLFLRAEENGIAQGQLLLLKGSRIHGLLANLPLHSITTRVSRAVAPAFSWIYGPVAESEPAASALLEKAAELSGGKLRTCIPHPLSPFENSFAKAGFREKKWATFLVDLRKGEEELWKAVDNAARKIARRTLEQADVVQVEDEGQYKAYHAVMNENRKRNKAVPYRYTPALWKIWRENGCGEVFIAKEKAGGRVLAGLGISSFNGYLNEWGAGTSSYAIENHVYAQDAIKWSVIKWAREKGFRYYDLTGVNPTPANEKEKGIFRFKEKWGGKLVEYGVYTR